MSFEHEKRQALHILSGIENGSMSASASFGLLRDADPTLVYFIFTWLRSYYHPRHPAAEGVLGRVVALLSAHPQIKSLITEGKRDALVEWFEDAYEYRDFDARAFIDLIVEKLEG